MAETKYAVVAYLPGKLGEFVHRLRLRLNPAYAAWLPHVSLLPPRPLQLPMGKPLETIRKQCALLEPFEVAIGGVATFWPVNGVVYLSFAAGSERLVQLHDALNSESLATQELYSYVAHVTLAQQLDEASTQSVLADAVREWSRYEANRSFRVESLVLVQQTPENCWIDLAAVPLGGFLARSRM